MKKLTFLLIPGLVAIAVFLVIAYTGPQSAERSTTSTQPELRFDAWSEQMNTVLYNADGDIDYTLEAERQIHLFDDTTELVQPLIQLFQEAGGHWNIVADSGRILPADESGENPSRTLELQGNVRVYNTDDYGNQTQLDTDFLTLDPSTKTATTESAISLTTPSITQNSIGMIADLSDNQITFLEANLGSYVQP